MGRKALEAVFGALGSGLVGYGRDEKRRYDETQDEMDREERRKRQELADSLTAAALLKSGQYGSEAQLRQRQGQGARTAMQAAFAAVPGMAGRTNAVLPTDMASSAGVLQRGVTPPKVSVGGQDLHLLESDTDQQRIAAAQGGMDRSARRADARSDAVFESELATKRDVAGVQARRSGDAAADRNDRTRRAAAEYIQRSKGRPDGMGGLITYLPSELQELRTEVYAAYGLNPDGSDLSVPSPTEPPPVAPATAVTQRSMAEILSNPVVPPPVPRPLPSLQAQSDASATVRSVPPPPPRTAGGVPSLAAWRGTRGAGPVKPVGVDQAEWDLYLRETGQMP